MIWSKKLRATVIVGALAFMLAATVAFLGYQQRHPTLVTARGPVSFSLVGASIAFQSDDTFWLRVPGKYHLALDDGTAPHASLRVDASTTGQNLMAFRTREFVEKLPQDDASGLSILQDAEPFYRGGGRDYNARGFIGEQLYYLPMRPGPRHVQSSEPVTPSTADAGKVYWDLIECVGWGGQGPCEIITLHPRGFFVRGTFSEPYLHEWRAIKQHYLMLVDKLITDRP